MDYNSNISRTFLAPTKSAASDKFGHFMAWFERSFNCKIHVLRTDGGKEFQGVDLLCERIGIRRQKAEPYNQASNGKAERMIRNILEFARSMLLASNLPLVFWGDAVLYANDIIIRIPTSANVNRLSPYEVAYKKTPYLGDLVPFGAKCTVMVSHKYGKKRKDDESSNLETKSFGRTDCGKE